jgi:hypothetical protein
VGLQINKYLEIGEKLGEWIMKKLLKINKDKGREVVGMLCKLRSCC